MKTLDLPLVLCLALAPIQWMTLFEVGGFSIEPFHLPILFLIGLAIANGKHHADVVAVLRQNALWLVPFAAYLLMLAVSLTYSRSSGGGSVLARQLLFSSLGVAVAARTLANPRIERSLFAGAVAGLVVYWLALFVSARHIGISVIGEHAAFFASGSFRELAYGFFRPVFNAFQGGGHEFGASLRNNVSSTLLVLFLVLRVARPRLEAGPMRRTTGAVASALLLASTIIVLSRSVVASWILSTALVLVLTTRRRGALLALATVTVSAALLGVAALNWDSPLVSGLFERLVFDTRSYSDRLTDYAFAMELVERNPIFGVGYYHLAEGEYQQPHNLFLAAWTQAGVLAFVSAILFVGGFCLHWARSILRTLAGPEPWPLHCDARWVMALPTMAMFRLWSSGDGGALNFSAWLSVGVFLGLVAQSRSPGARSAGP